MKITNSLGESLEKKLDDLETELVTNTFITNRRNVEIQKNLCIEYITQKNVLAYVLVHEKGTKIYQPFVKHPVNSSFQNYIL